MMNNTTNELKEGTILCSREWNYYFNSHQWSFVTVKKVTPTGKIRLENNKLLDRIEPYRIYDDEMKTLYAKDCLKDNVKAMLDSLYTDKKVFKNLSCEKIYELGKAIERLNLELSTDWSVEYAKKHFNKNLSLFRRYSQVLEDAEHI